ncbi:N-acetyltransferase 9 [Gonapodya sp. JEL0774]|nr:N-acetyltransferase 9 [Gonapodya sp. JEL0774]
MNGKLILYPCFHHEGLETQELRMKDPVIQHLTASEPLELDEEYQMQRSWREDNDKLTFIVLDPVLEGLPQDGRGGGMVGDVNLFFTDIDSPRTAELEVMVAEPKARGKGIGEATCRMMMEYAAQLEETETGHFPVSLFRAKIKFDNTPSLKLFEKLGFKEVSRSAFFEEVTLELAVDAGLVKTVQSVETYVRTAN